MNSLTWIPYTTGEDSPEHHGNRLTLEGNRVGTAYDTGEVLCLFLRLGVL